MNLTENDIENLAEEFKSSLRQANGELKKGALSLKGVQEWAIKNHIEHPRVVETIIAKQGTGSAAGKKNLP